MTGKSIFIIDDDVDLLKMLAIYFTGAGFDVHSESDGRKAIERLSQDVFDVIICDLMLNGVSGIEVLSTAKRVTPRTEVIIVTGYSSVDSAVQAMKEGAFEYITKPIDLEELNIIVRKAAEHQQLLAEVDNLRSQVRTYTRLDNVIAVSPKMQSLLSIVRRIADTSATVLIEGQSGTGKEVIARAIHNCGSRSARPFVAVNCAAMPETLLESELFGHLKGAFTGAHSTKKGLFEEAHRGTIFLDEIGETSPAFQVKLLRVLQESEIRRVGDTRAIPVDVRVLASSNTTIQELVEQGRFRQDLYFRLRVIPLHLPSLKERREDILPLARFFIERYCTRSNRAPVRISPEAIRKLESHRWPGNVRELENTIERAMILVEGDVLQPADIQLEFSAPSGPQQSGFTPMSMRDVERRHILQMLEYCNWNQSEAARRLQIGYNTLWRKIRDYGIER